MAYTPVRGEVFHVHTSRCKHASLESDIEYVWAALDSGASRLVFTDHVPYPGDQIPYRMDMSELQDYIDSINSLKIRFAGQIEILCGLEIEFLPSYLDYYKDLRSMPGIDLLILGQHFYEQSDGLISVFNYDKTNEPWGQSLAIAEGIKTGLFDVVAHPDRVFRSNESFGPKEREYASKMIDAAYPDGNWSGVYFEWNFSSSMRKGFLTPEFWDMIPDRSHIIYGLDAHSTYELIEGYANLENWRELIKNPVL